MSTSRVLLTIALLASLPLPIAALPPFNPDTSHSSNPAPEINHDHYVTANDLLGFVSNVGMLFYDREAMFGRNNGLYYPYESTEKILSGELNKTLVYSAGIWLGGLVDGETRVAVAEYSYEYWPGLMVDGSYDPYGDITSAYRVYKLYVDSMADNPNEDYFNWPEGQGAPFSEGIPAAHGDQTLYAVYNDANPRLHTNDAGNTSPLGIEVRQTAWASRRNEPGSSANTAIYVKYELHNKSLRTIHDFYMGIWADPDLGDPSDDLVGCDTILRAFYCYNGDNDDGIYGSTCPAVGFSILQGPVVPSVGDTARAFGRWLPGNSNLRPVAFSKYINGTDPVNYLETYSFLQGSCKLSGTMVPCTYNGLPTKFACSGDPVAGTGDLDINSADRRMMASIGPFTFFAGDSQQVIIKWAVGQGVDNLASVTKLKSILADEPAEPPCCLGRTGNVNITGIVDLPDLSTLVAYLSSVPSPKLQCLAEADVDASGGIDALDLAMMVDYMTGHSTTPLPQCR